MAQITVTMKLRHANKSDFYDRQTGYKNGILYFMRSAITGQFDAWPYYLSDDTDKQELNVAYKAKQLFVPVRLFDDCEVEIHEIQNTESA